MYLYRDPEGQNLEHWGQGDLEKRSMWMDPWQWSWNVKIFVLNINTFQKTSTQEETQQPADRMTQTADIFQPLSPATLVLTQWNHEGTTGLLSNHNRLQASEPGFLEQDSTLHKVTEVLFNNFLLFPNSILSVVTLKFGPQQVPKYLFGDMVQMLFWQVT